MDSDDSVTPYYLSDLYACTHAGIGLVVQSLNHVRKMVKLFMNTSCRRNIKCMIHLTSQNGKRTIFVTKRLYFQ